MASVQVQTEESSGEMIQRNQRAIIATIGNTTEGDMKLDRFRNWAGGLTEGTFPTTIESKGNRVFMHARNRDNSSVAALQYSGLNTGGLECAWLVAWLAPANTPPARNKVYITCGTKRDVEELSWEKIHQNLEASSSSATVTDPQSKTVVEARIAGQHSGIGILNVSFGLAS